MTTDWYTTKVAAWQEAKAAVEAWKTREVELRLEIFNAAFPTPKEGTNYFTTPSGITIKCTYKLNRKIDDAGKLAAATGLIEGAEWEQFITLKYSFKTGKYNTLQPQERARIDEHITTTPGLPDLTVEVPEA